jgi:cyclase
LLINERDLVKTIKFKAQRYLGDPVNAVKIFNNKGVDELTILDITATKEKKEPNFELLREIATEAFMPLSYGGGITNLEQIQRLFSIGYEKVILNTALIENPELVEAAIEYAGSQSIVASIDAKKDIFGKYLCYTHDGQEKTTFSPTALAKYVAEMGVGEILLNSINNDGEMNGYDLKLISDVCNIVKIPVIACGGASNINDLKEVLEKGHAHAAAAGSMFVYYGKQKAVLITAPSEKELTDAGIYSE